MKTLFYPALSIAVLPNPTTNRVILPILLQCSPTHTTNREFIRTRRKTATPSFYLPAPTWPLKMDACLIGTATELLLNNTQPTLPSPGLRFSTPNPEPAMENIIQSLPGRRYQRYN